MRAQSQADLVVWRSPHRRVDLRVKIEDGDGTLQNVSDLYGNDFLIAVEVGDDVDASSMDATITLAREIYNDSLAPLMRESRLNLNSGGSYDPLLHLGREVVIEAAYAAGPNAGRGSWHEIFRGAIDEIKAGGYELQVICRDQMRTLQDTFIESRDEYSNDLGVAVETVMQQIIDDWIDSPPTLYVPTSPGWVVTRFHSQKQSVYDQLKLLVDQIGWSLKYKWDDGTSSFRLTFWGVDRGVDDEDITIKADEYYDITAFDSSIKDVRNAVTVRFPDADKDPKADGSPRTSSVTVEDATSIGLYGRRWMGVTEDAASIIDTMEEATRMANAILTDLKLPKVSQVVEMPFFLWVETNDVIEFWQNDVHYSQATKLAVMGYRHQFTAKECRTTLYCRGEYRAGQYHSWRDLEGRNGNAKKQSELDPDVSDLVATETVGGTLLTWKNSQAPTEPPHVSDTGGQKDIIYEIYVTPVGGTPGASDLLGSTRGTSFQIQANALGSFPVDTALDFHVRAVNRYGDGAFATASSKRALPVGSAGISSKAQHEGLSSNFNEQSKGTGYPTDGWEMVTGTWDTDALLDDGTTYAGVASQYGSTFLLLK